MSRFIDSVAVVATVCAVLLLAKSCLCVTDVDDDVLEKKQLTEFYSKLNNLAAAAGPSFFMLMTSCEITPHCPELCGERRGTTCSRAVCDVD